MIIKKKKKMELHIHDRIAVKTPLSMKYHDVFIGDSGSWIQESGSSPQIQKYSYCT